MNGQTTDIRANWLMNRYFLIPLVVTVAASILASLGVSGHVRVEPLAAAWVLLLANGVAARWIDMRSVSAPNLPLFWGVGMNGVRSMCVVLVLVAASHAQLGHAETFLIVTILGYFIFQFGQILQLHHHTLAKYGS